MRQNDTWAIPKMFRPAQRLKLSRGILAAVVAVVVLPSVTLVALGIRLLDQDHALEERRRARYRTSVDASGSYPVHLLRECRP